MTVPQFLYFDLGNVLLHFDRDRGFRRLAQHLQVELSAIQQVVLHSGLLWRYETGELSTERFFQQVCKDLNVPPQNSQFLAHANCDIFWPNYSLLPVLGALSTAGYRMGVLSNICDTHWEWCKDHYAHVGKLFSLAALSYELGSIKPDPKIYQRAQALAGVPAEAIFFTDDLEENIVAARAQGWNAVHYTSTPALVAFLRSQGLQFNY